MQVKKFEASSMKDALEMVKTELGPDAIILAAHDNKKFGLMGKSSVEVTAAVSEAQLKKRQIAQKNLRQQELDKFKGSSARTQKAFIEKSINRFLPDATRAAVNEMRYVDIEDDEANKETNQLVSKGRRVDSILEDLKSKPTKTYSAASGKKRVREAVQTALKAAQTTEASPAKVVKPVAPPQGSIQVKELQDEIRQLRSMIGDYQNGPQERLSLHPGADRGIPYELSESYQRLVGEGLDSQLVTEILLRAQGELGEDRVKRSPIVQAWLAKFFLGDIQVVSRENEARYQVFVGSSAQGRTSALIKLATQLVLKERKKVGIVTCDSDRVTSVEQLRIYSKILNAKFEIVSSENDWKEIDRKFSDCDVILIEMPGMSLKNEGEIEKLRSLLPPARPSIATHYVQSVTWKDADAIEVLTRYIRFGVTDLVFTKLDETTNYGMIYNLQRRFGLPLYGFNHSGEITDDFEFATKERVLDLLFKITKSSSGEGN